jgi:hypothetical protein
LIAPAQAAVDGRDIPSDFGNSPLAVQTNPTQFGDAVDGSPNGSELDAFYGDLGPAGLSIGLTGNLEANGNALVLLLDTLDGGSEVLNASNTTFKLTNANGMTFDTGFAPDHAFVFNTFGGTLYTDYADLIDPSRSTYLGATDTAGAALLALGGSALFAMDNSNILGVTGADAAGALTANTGLEMLLDPLAFGVPAGFSNVRMMAYIVSGGGDYLSNQFLPGLPAGSPNLGSPSGVDFRQYEGAQYVSLRGNAIPEPGTMALLGMGLLPALGLRRRRA